MPETPDFDQIARRVIAQAHSFGIVERHEAELIRDVTEQLRLVWNARGAADIVALEPIIGKLGDTMDPDNARIFVRDRIRAVDR